jgi:hypothetical protein
MDSISNVKHRKQNNVHPDKDRSKNILHLSIHPLSRVWFSFHIKMLAEEHRQRDEIFCYFIHKMSGLRSNAYWILGFVKIIMKLILTVIMSKFSFLIFNYF